MITVDDVIIRDKKLAIDNIIRYLMGNLVGTTTVPLQSGITHDIMIKVQFRSWIFLSDPARIFYFT